MSGANRPGPAAPLSRGVCSDALCCSAVAAQGVVSGSFHRLFRSERLVLRCTMETGEVFHFPACVHLVAHFLREDGSLRVALRCGAYDERPTACRLYPEGFVEETVGPGGEVASREVVRDPAPGLYNELLASDAYRRATYGVAWRCAWLVDERALNEPDRVALAPDVSRGDARRWLVRLPVERWEGRAWRQLDIDRDPRRCLITPLHPRIRSIPHAWAAFPADTERKARETWGRRWRRALLVGALREWWSRRRQTRST